MLAPTLPFLRALKFTLRAMPAPDTGPRALAALRHAAIAMPWAGFDVPRGPPLHAEAALERLVHATGADLNQLDSPGLVFTSGNPDDRTALLRWWTCAACLAFPDVTPLFLDCRASMPPHGLWREIDGAVRQLGFAGSRALVCIDNVEALYRPAMDGPGSWKCALRFLCDMRDALDQAPWAAQPTIFVMSSADPRLRIMLSGYDACSDGMRKEYPLLILAPTIGGTPTQLQEM